MGDFTDRNSRVAILSQRREQGLQIRLYYVGVVVGEHRSPKELGFEAASFEMGVSLELYDCAAGKWRALPVSCLDKIV